MSENIDLMNSLLNTSFDDIEDLPDFVTPVPGAYNLGCVKAEFVTDEENDKAFVNIVWQILGVVEQEKDKVDYPEGTLFGTRYYGEFGIKKFKKIYAALIEQLNCSNAAELIDQMENAEVLAIVTNRSDKDDKSIKYADIQTVQAV